ncbi:MAG TPA: bifunctional 4-hydroxy-2-oxoglutarate aldolase/2-dehydro-3-deoxy-phosphogluconate aldolase [Rubrobacter sp.]|nr:bifunctional 4-hydroxy-2-oxoglutarate aldolase/2-dehydro-3-deoxy-phosphogluconate aldolase [Rubrobacter sp.]
MNVAQRIAEERIIAIVRLEDLSEARRISEALLEGGVSVVEFTLTNPDAIRVIENLRKDVGGLLLGAGTVLDEQAAYAAIMAGASFLVTPTVAPGVVEQGLLYGVPVICGGMTPTELLHAHSLGCEMVKVFPAGALGPGFLKDVRGPLPQLQMIPTGGIQVSNVASFLEAGAVAVGVGSALVSADKSPEEIAETASRFAAEARRVAEG